MHSICVYAHVREFVPPTQKIVYQHIPTSKGNTHTKNETRAMRVPRFLAAWCHAGRRAWLSWTFQLTSIHAAFESNIIDTEGKYIIQNESHKFLWWSTRSTVPANVNFIREVLSDFACVGGKTPESVFGIYTSIAKELVYVLIRNVMALRYWWIWNARATDARRMDCKWIIHSSSRSNTSKPDADAAHSFQRNGESILAFGGCVVGGDMTEGRRTHRTELDQT